MLEEKKYKQTGGLTIFLGYAPGVGKTRRMLEAGQNLLMAGVDVAIACMDEALSGVEKDLLRGLEQIHCHKPGSELDLDEVLARNPRVVLVDRMAITNPPEARHPFRWQDIEELLSHGLSVYTTLNVDEIESLADLTLRITGRHNPGSVPDRLLDTAELVLVDYPPDEILRKSPNLPSGLSNLLSLRELAFNRAARHIDLQIQRKPVPESSNPAPVQERLMVCVSTHPLSERLVRTGCRLARELNASWTVVYVETPDRLRFSQPHSERLARILRLAEELGAQVTGISGRTVPEVLVDYAHSNLVTQIIIGKPLRPRFVELINVSVVDEVIRLSGPVDVYVISDESGPIDKGFPGRWLPHQPWSRYLYAALLVAGVSFINIPIHLLIEPTNLVMIYLLAVIISALYLGRGPSIMASLLSVLAFDFFFVDPRLSFRVVDTQYILTFFGLFGTGLAVSSLAGLVRDQVESSQKREARTATLYNLSRELTISRDLETVLKTVHSHLVQTFDREAVILLPGEHGLEVRAAHSGLALSSTELEAADWAYRHARPAGPGTDTLPQTSMRWQSFQTAQGVVGVLGVRQNEPSRSLSQEQRQLLEAYSSLAGLAIERASLAEQASRNHLLQEAEKLQTALLNSISHDLRTPLASITGVFSSLHEAEVDGVEVVMDHATRLELIDTGWEESERLNRLVGNLLDMTRLEAGAIRLNLEEGDIEDVIGAALARLRTRLRDHTIHTIIPSGHPLASMDFVLIEQVLVNLLDNAAKYSPLGSEIEIGVEASGQDLSVWVADHGRGVPTEDLARIFEKFYRVQRPDTISGTGLGLSICKGILEAHNGTVRAESRPEGGTRILFSIPLHTEIKRLSL